MKKIFVSIFILSTSFFLFSSEEKEQVENKKLGIELKTMINAGYENISGNGDIFIELEASKRFDVDKINTIFNVGGGVDFTSFFGDGGFVGVLNTYLLTEVGGYVSKDTRLYTNMKVGVGIKKGTNDDNSNTLPKFEFGLGVLYKHLSVEASYNVIGALTLGIGARFGF